MPVTIYEDLYEFKNKLSNSKFEIFIDGNSSGFILSNSISEQKIYRKNADALDYIEVEDFVESYANTILLATSIQFYPSVRKFIELYPDTQGLNSAVYVEELREIHIKSNSMNQLEESTEPEFRRLFDFMSHVNYKSLCLRYNQYMGNSKSSCGTLKKKFSGLIYAPCKFNMLELATNEKVSELALDDSIDKIGSIDITHRLPNGKHLSGDVKDTTRACLVFHKNEFVKHFVNFEKDVVKREFINNDILYMDLIHLLMFPELKDVTGHLISVNGASDFIVDDTRDVTELVTDILTNAKHSICTYLEFIYYRNRLNYMDLNKFKQLVEEML